MQDQQKQLIAKLKEAQNVLVTVSKNPSVDQLAAAIGFTLALNKLDKHATAVFSGQVPDTIEFLKPEETLEKTTDSLRDFIIALDKSKADKLRYKVEDQVVRIFITPYRTSISEKDLDFSQGDFNVDVVVALGVPEQQDLDEAIQAHGRILHDATVASLSITGQQELGTLNVVDTSASSLSELVASIVEELGKELIDSQIATALLTGIVAMTNRFSNDRTSPKTMSISSVLMAAGANQQLIATELETSPAPQSVSESGGPVEVAASEPPKEPGMLEIEHTKADVTPEDKSQDSPVRLPEPEEASSKPVEPLTPQIHVDDEGRIVPASPDGLPQISPARTSGDIGQQPEPQESTSRERIVEPPSRDSALSANTEEEGFDATTEELTLPPTQMPILSHDAGTTSAMAEVPIIDTKTSQEPTPGVEGRDYIDTARETLEQIEESVDSPHLENTVQSTDAPKSIDDARSAVEKAFETGQLNSSIPDPIAALNAQPLGPDLHEDVAPSTAYQPAPGFGSGQPQHFDGGIPGDSPGDQSLDMPLPSVPSATPTSSFPGIVPSSSQQQDTLPPPPPVPPPPIFPA